MSVAIITARGGSRRIQRKNIRDFHGKPIIAYSIEAAKRAKVDRIIVSTDDEEIRDVAWSYGAKYMDREPAFASDEIGTRAVMARCIEQLGLKDNEHVFCIYPCAPLLTDEDFYTAQWLLVMRPAYFVVTVGTEPLADAGALYLSLADHWRKSEDELPIYGIRTAFLPLPKERACDINTPEDWLRAERMYAELHGIAA